MWNFGEREIECHRNARDSQEFLTHARELLDGRGRPADHLGPTSPTCPSRSARRCPIIVVTRIT